MRVIAGFGLLLAIVGGVIMIPEITTLENTGASLSGIGDDLKGVFNKLTLFMIVTLLGLAVGTVIFAMVALFGRR